MKLLYLAERLSMKRYGDTITGDSFVSMPQGPVLSMTYDHMNGGLESQEGGWDTWISDRADNWIALRDESMIRSPEEDLLVLSQSDLESRVRFGWSSVTGINGSWLNTPTPRRPEWEDPMGSSRPIRRHAC